MSEYPQHCPKCGQPTLSIWMRCSYEYYNTSNKLVMEDTDSPELVSIACSADNCDWEEDT